MRKKMETLSQASLKISKHQKKHQRRQQQQQFNSLIKVLKPKVYITDTFGFKKLVQELTGNGRKSEHDGLLLICPESSTKVITAPEMKDHHHHHHHPHEGDDSSDQYLSNQASSPTFLDGASNRQVFDQTYSFEGELITLEHSTSNSEPMVDSLSPSVASVSESPSFSSEDLESWLLDMEITPAALHYSEPMVDSLSPSGASVSKSPSFSSEDLESWFRDMETMAAAPVCNGLAQLEPEVSIYDYDLHDHLELLFV
ncbi:hypothetical protein ACJRO7_002016 [Eucalyptus globulus]|uniref:VQ domain-containing protein n=1 Tax=Eucalyptus globulus TaxID=34317 RepID=A0ABD3LY16_EUCGL